MEKISKINVQGTDYEVQDKALTDIVNNISKQGVYNLTSNSFYDLIIESANKDICANTNNLFLTFAFDNAGSGKESGYILNIINGIDGNTNKIYQYLYWKQGLRPEMTRTLALQDGEIVALNTDGSIDDTKNFYPYSEPIQNFCIDNVAGPTLFSLKTGADPTEALKNTIYTNIPGGGTPQTPITREQLEFCATHGYCLMDYSMYNPIWVGRDAIIADGFNLVSFGKQNPMGQPSVMSITISVTQPNEEGVSTYKVERDGTKGVIVTEAPKDGNTYVRKNGVWVKIKTDYNEKIFYDVLNLNNSSSVEDISNAVGTLEIFKELVNNYNIYTGLEVYGIKNIPINVTDSGDTYTLQCTVIDPLEGPSFYTIILAYSDNSWTGCDFHKSSYK